MERVYFEKKHVRSSPDAPEIQHKMLPHGRRKCRYGFGGEARNSVPQAPAPAPAAADSPTPAGAARSHEPARHF
jgi:hypothetical protein